MSFSFSSRGILATIATAATLSVAPLSAQNIDQPFNGSPVYNFGNAGAGFIPTIGQSFVATGSLLTSFTFWLSNEASLGTGGSNTPNAEELTFQAYLAAWDGTGIVGPLLYSSALQSGPLAVSQAYTFNTGALALTGGASYIAFLTVPDMSLLESSAALEESDDASGSGQAFISFNADVNALVTGGGGEWVDLNGKQLHFQATIVPEPSTGLMLVAGLAAVLLVSRRRRA
jgi:hypothetical protein